MRRVSILSLLLKELKRELRFCSNAKTYFFVDFGAKVFSHSLQKIEFSLHSFNCTVIKTRLKYLS